MPSSQGAPHSEQVARLGQGGELVARAHGLAYIVMRLYWPKTTPPFILPAGKGAWNPPGFVRTLASSLPQVFLTPAVIAMLIR